MQARLGVVLYVRVSSEEQVDGYSLDAQEAVLRQDAARRNIPVVKVYKDPGASGVREDRKGLNELLRDASRGLFSEVLVWTVSRVSRKLRYLLHVLAELKKLGIAFRSLNEQFDLTTPMGQFAMTMMGAVAQMQRESWMESSRIGMKQRVRSGRWGGGMMLGYRMVPDENDPKRGGKLEIIPAEAELVKEIFTLYADGLGYKAIVNRLNQDGKRGKCGKMFAIASVQGIVNNAIYIGKVHFGPDYYEGVHEPIISQDLWDKVQQRLAQQKKRSKSVFYEYLLSGVLRCPVCGSGMLPTHVKGKRKDGSFRMNYYYSCGQYLNKGKSACTSRSVRADIAEQAVLDWLFAFLTKPFWIKKVIEAIRQRYDSTVKPREDKRQEAEACMAAIAKKQSELLQSYENDKLSREVFLQKMQRLKLEKETWQEQLNQNDSMDEQPIKACWGENELTLAFRSFRAILQEADAATKRQLIRALIAKVHVGQDRASFSMEWKLPFERLNTAGVPVVISQPLPLAT